MINLLLINFYGKHVDLKSLIYAGLLIIGGKKMKISQDFQEQIRGKIGRFRGKKVKIRGKIGQFRGILAEKIRFEGFSEANS